MSGGERATPQIGPNEEAPRFGWLAVERVEASRRLARPPASNLQTRQQLLRLPLVNEIVSRRLLCLASEGAEARREGGGRSEAANASHEPRRDLVTRLAPIFPPNSSRELLFAPHTGELLIDMSRASRRGAFGASDGRRALANERQPPPTSERLPDESSRACQTSAQRRASSLGPLFPLSARVARPVSSLAGRVEHEEASHDERAYQATELARAEFWVANADSQVV